MCVCANIHFNNLQFVTLSQLHNELEHVDRDITVGFFKSESSPLKPRLGQ